MKRMSVATIRILVDEESPTIVSDTISEILNKAEAQERIKDWGHSKKIVHKKIDDKNYKEGDFL